MRSWTILLSVASVVLFIDCSDDGAQSGGSGDTVRYNLEILQIDAPAPAVDGSPIVIGARGIDSSGGDVSLTLRNAGTGERIALEEVDAAGNDELVFRLTSAAIAAIGVGTLNIEFTLRQGDDLSRPFPGLFTTSTSLDVWLDEVPSGSVFRNEEIILRGDAMISKNEGTLEAVLEGDYLPDGASTATPLNVRLPVVLVEQLARNRGLLRLTTAIGGLTVGTFTGTVRLEQTLSSGFSSVSGNVSVELSFGPPVIFSISTTEPALGQIISVNGGGFLGGSGEPDETTILRLEGEILPEGGVAGSFGPEEVVTVTVSGEEVELGIEVDTVGGSLVSRLFGISRGRFEGTVVPVTLSGHDELEGDPFALTLELSGMRQVVVVSFLPSFQDSLRHYGLTSAATHVIDTAIDRMRTIYDDYAVVFYLNAPLDALGSAISHLEIGGPDPNGLGLLGYDNTPGKDVGNLRLFDTIGGENSQTQEDGYPGYGGVFIDSFLYWSANPGLPGPRPAGSPPSEPLFDEIFGPVRAQPATLAEADGEGATQRVEQVARAIRALGSMVGETSAHEVGHSLGLAQPFGPTNAYHSLVPGGGCLMDSGSERPLGERAMEPGFSETHFCFDEPDYLGQILGN